MSVCIVRQGAHAYHFLGRKRRYVSRYINIKYDARGGMGEEGNFLGTSETWGLWTFSLIGGEGRLR